MSDLARRVDHLDDVVMHLTKRVAALEAAANAPYIEPCPFCGADAEEEQLDATTYTIRCDGTGACPHPAAFGQHREHALTLWNRRV